MRVVAYTDGSYDKYRKYGTYGAVVICRDNIIGKLKGKVTDKQLNASWNVGAEIMGVYAVLDLVDKLRVGIKNERIHLTIYHDYEGLGKWATGEWRAKKAISQDYYTRTNKLIKEGLLEFIWVKGHSGCEYNELADRLANEAYNA